MGKKAQDQYQSQVGMQAADTQEPVEELLRLLHVESAARVTMAQRLEPQLQAESAARIAMVQRLDVHCDLQRQVCEELRADSDAAMSGAGFDATVAPWVIEM